MRTTDTLIFKRRVGYCGGLILDEMLTINNHLLVLYLLFLQSIWVVSWNSVNLNYQVADFRRNPQHSHPHQRPFRRKVVGVNRRVIGGAVVPRGSRPYMVIYH